MAELEGALRMTIAYFIASPTWGGGEQYVFDLARHMKAQFGVQPFFLFPSRSDKSMIRRFEEIGACMVFPYAGKAWRFLPYAGHRMAQILDEHQTDILHINSRHTYFMAVWAKRYAKHPFRLLATQHLVRPAKKGLFWKWIYRQIDVLDCVSQTVKQAYLQPLGGQTVFPDVRVIYNSAPIVREDACVPKQESEEVRLLYHGRICREKGIEQLFKALGKIADLPFRMTFAGNIGKHDKALWDQLLATCPARDKIRHIGFCPDMRTILCESHIGISPSIVREAGPLAMIEQMAFGLAVITSDNGSQPEFIQDGVNGLLCPPQDPQALADALRRLITDPTLRRQLGEQAQRDFFALHTYDRFIEDMYHLYTEIYEKVL